MSSNQATMDVSLGSATLTTTKTTSVAVIESESKECELSGVTTQRMRELNDKLLSTFLVNSDVLRKSIETAFVNKYNQSPSEHEINDSIYASLDTYLNNLEIEEQNDSDYSPDNEEDTIILESDLNDENEFETQLENEAKTQDNNDDTTVITHSTSIVESDDYQRHFREALQSMREMELVDKTKLFDSVRDSMKSEGQNITDEELSNALNTLNVTLMENDANNCDNMQYGTEEEEEEQDPILELTEEELQIEIAQAMDAVRRAGRIDGLKIAESVKEAFYELNGREPLKTEIKAVFKRIQNKFENEAKEDALEAMKEEQRNVCEKGKKLLITDATPISATTSAATLTSDTAHDIASNFLQYARSVIAKDLQRQAYQQLAQLIPNRQPTIDEINDTILSLCQTHFLLSNINNDNDCNDSSDSDYDPINDTEANALIMRDEMDEREFENSMKTMKKEDSNESKDTEEKEEMEINLPLKTAPVLTTPVKTKGKSSARVDFYFAEYNDNTNDFLKDKAFASFQRTHQREPNNEEMDNISKFLKTEKTIEAQFDDDMIDVD